MALVRSVLTVFGSVSTRNEDLVSLSGFFRACFMIISEADNNIVSGRTLVSDTKLRKYFKVVVFKKIFDLLYKITLCHFLPGNQVKNIVKMLGDVSKGEVLDLLLSDLGNQLGSLSDRNLRTLGSVL